MVAISITSAGAEEIILTWRNDMNDIEDLRVFAEGVLAKA